MNRSLPYVLDVASCTKAIILRPSGRAGRFHLEAVPHPLGVALRFVVWMPSKVRLDERTHRDEAQAFGAGGVQSGFDQGFAEMLTTQGGGTSV